MPWANNKWLIIRLDSLKSSAHNWSLLTSICLLDQYLRRIHRSISQGPRHRWPLKSRIYSFWNRIRVTKRKFLRFNSMFKMYQMAKPNLIIQDNFIHRRIQIIPEDRMEQFHQINHNTTTPALCNCNNYRRVPTLQNLHQAWSKVDNK